MTVFPATAQFRLHRKFTIRNGSGQSHTNQGNFSIHKAMQTFNMLNYCPGTRGAMTLTRTLTTKLIIPVYSPSTWVAIAK